MEKNKLKKFNAGEILIKENNMSRKMFIIKKGKVRVYKTYFDRKVTLAVLGTGEIFGELSFFDAEPRSASCEALTPLEVVVFDGNEAKEEIGKLPTWVVSVFKSVFYRFRELDNKITVLQSMHDFQKTTMAKDTPAQTIYLELLRLNKLFEIVFKDLDWKTHNHVNYIQLYKSMEELSGKNYLNLRVYFRVLSEHNMLSINGSGDDAQAEIFFERIEQMNNYLKKEIDSDRNLLLSHSSVAFLRAVIGWVDSSGQSIKRPPVMLKGFTYDHIPLHHEAAAELKKYKIIEPKEMQLLITSEELHDHYIYQSIVKAFDHTIMRID
ncbi:MAG: cyclic nucleotide-binding domain-containing protein [Bacteriovoracaceae bacterium]|nr:cyclic nucleotide-binding domain-containing protein [Bacteriovoracaceae bacterium]